MNYRARLAVVGAWFITAGPVFSHPHIFIDAGIELRRDDAGRVVSVDVIWQHDALYSMTLLSDRSLDKDFDLELTETEKAAILGFDLVWEYGFEGGLLLRQDDVFLEFGPPEPLSVTLADSGQLLTRHRRAVHNPTQGKNIVVQFFDPDEYYGFTLTLPFQVVGAPECKPTYVPWQSRPNYETFYEDLMVISCPE